MKDYFQILGVSESATDAEIKTAFKRLARQHHPDKGGDEAKFKEINEAYEILKDPGKRQEWQAQKNFGYGNTSAGPFANMDEFFSSGDFGEMFRGFKFNHAGMNTGRRVVSNKHVNITIGVTLEDLYNTTEKIINLTLPSGKQQTLTVNIPAGIADGAKIKYSRLGDDSDPNLPPGDLLVTVNTMPHAVFERYDFDLYTEQRISCFDAIRGTSLELQLPNGKQTRIKVPPGTQPNTSLQLHGQGLPLNNTTDKRGNVFVKIKITIPTLTPQQLEQIKNL